MNSPKFINMYEILAMILIFAMFLSYNSPKT